MLKPRSFPFSRFLPVMSSVVVLLAMGASTADATESIGIDEVERGMKGYGLSVFAGTDQATFDVEVLGILQDSTPELSYIIARLTGQDLERAGVSAGMSGSPVYLDGRLAGAVAFSYLFGLDAIAGITPIAAMRGLIPPPGASAFPRAGEGLLPTPGLPATSSLSGGPVPEVRQLATAQVGADLLERHLARWATPPISGATSSLAWSATGFGEPALAALRQGLGDGATLTTAGGLANAAGLAGTGATEIPASTLKGGSPVAAVLVDGDLGLAAHGTVTERDGDEILAFGHPLFGFGPARFPLATAEVVTIIANRYSSFKVSNMGEIVGAFEEDRQAGAWGRLGVEAPMIPVSVELDAERDRRYEVRLADLPPLSPALLAISVYGALDAGARAGGAQSLDVEAVFDLGERGRLPVRQSFDGEDAALQLISHLLGFAAWIENNDLETPPLERVDVKITQHPLPRITEVLGARASHREVAPGQKIQVTLDLREWRGGVRSEVVDVTIPVQASEGPYILLLGEGPRMDGTRLAVEKWAATSFDDTLETLAGLHSRADLVTLGLQVRPGVAFPGASLPGLPGSMRQLFGASGQSPKADVLSFAVLAEEVVAFDRPLAGSVRLDLRVRRPRAEAR